MQQLNEKIPAHRLWLFVNRILYHMIISKFNLFAIVFLLWLCDLYFQLLTDNFRTLKREHLQKNHFKLSIEFNSIQINSNSVSFVIYRHKFIIFFFWLSKTIWTDKIGAFWWCGQFRKLGILDFESVPTKINPEWLTQLLRLKTLESPNTKSKITLNHSGAWNSIEKHFK